MSAQVEEDGGEPALRLVVRHVTPTVRPQEVLAGLAAVAGFAPAQEPRATRLRQGPLHDGVVVDPLAVD